MRPGWVALSLLALACGKSNPQASNDSHTRAQASEPGAVRGLEDELHESMDEDDYEPSALDVPLASDFAKAAQKRVTPENYTQELTRIERELSYEERGRTAR